MTALPPQNNLQENSYKEYSLPFGPQNNDVNFCKTNSLHIDYQTPPMYCANAATLPTSENSFGTTTSTYLSNTLPPGYTPNYGVQTSPNFSVPLFHPGGNLPISNQQLLLYDTTTGLFYDPNQCQQQSQPLPSVGTISKLPTQQNNNAAPNDTDNSDTTSESSWSSDYSQEKRRSKNKTSSFKNRKSSKNSRKRQNKPNNRRRRRRKR